MFPLYDERSLEGGALCKLRSRLLAAAGGNLRFGCQHPAPRRIRSRGHPFRVADVSKKILIRGIRTKRTRFETFGGQKTGYRKVAWRWTNKYEYEAHSKYVILIGVPILYQVYILVKGSPSAFPK